MSDENLQMELMYRAVFIDWDDTIGDWGQVARKSQRELYNKYHLAEWFETPEEWFEKYNTHNTELWVRYGKRDYQRLSVSRPFSVSALPTDRYHDRHGTAAFTRDGEEDGRRICLSDQHLLPADDRRRGSGALSGKQISADGGEQRVCGMSVSQNGTHRTAAILQTYCAERGGEYPKAQSADLRKRWR